MLAAVLLSCFTARAEDVDDQYVGILSLVQQGDVLKNSGNTAAALAKYRAAQAGLNDFRKAHAEWNAKIINYRWNVIAQKIADLTGGAAAETGATSGTEMRAAQGGTKAAPSFGRVAKLLDAGAEPRKVLRYHPKAGDKQTLQMTMKMGTETKMGEMQVPMKLPPIIMTIDTTIKDVASSGDITYDTVISDATTGDEEGANPQIAAAMKTQVAGIKGHTITGTVSDRGVNKKGDQSSEANAKGGDISSQLGEGVSDLSAVELPEEAVGAGAKWEVRKPSNSKGITATEVTTVQLVSIEGDRLTAKATINETAQKQKIPNPMMPGTKVDLNKMTGTGSAEMSFDLGQLMPTTGKMEMHNEMQMSTGVGNQKQPMTVKTDANLTLEAKQ